MGAITRLAQAAGAYVQPDPDADALRVLPRYPVLPWNWGATTPDVEIPVDILVREAVRPIVRPAYNQVHVTGQNQGVTARLRRQGSARDIEAPMIDRRDRPARAYCESVVTSSSNRGLFDRRAALARFEPGRRRVCLRPRSRRGVSPGTTRVGATLEARSRVERGGAPSPTVAESRSPKAGRASVCAASPRQPPGRTRPG